MNVPTDCAFDKAEGTIRSCTPRASGWVFTLPRKSWRADDSSITYMAFYNNCERELAQVTRGRSLVLVYDLICTPPPTSASGGAADASVKETAGEARGSLDKGALATTASPQGSVAAVTMSKKEAQDWSKEDWPFFESTYGVTGLSLDVDTPGSRRNHNSRGRGDVLDQKAETTSTTTSLSSPSSSSSALTDGGVTGVAGYRGGHRQQAARTRATEDALRRKQAVFGSSCLRGLPPQPANVELVADISRAIRDWSAGE